MTQEKTYEFQEKIEELDADINNAENMSGKHSKTISGMTELSGKIASLALTPAVPDGIRVEVTALIADLLGGGKDGHTCIKSNLVTTREVADGLFGHLYNFRGGYLVSNHYLNQSYEQQVIECLNQNI
ncbi:hypothetical protein ACJJIF_21400 [Microbulbifer sp. SSSA002]|uniref:hypothetical protein n=1 Tax=unclassified Microbulbifer TaxID=2619833 RepID=UPI0040391989